MRITPAVTTTVTRPNRILLALATAWMIASIALGGVVNGQSAADPASTTSGQTIVHSVDR